MGPAVAICSPPFVTYGSLSWGRSLSGDVGVAAPLSSVVATAVTAIIPSLAAGAPALMTSGLTGPRDWLPCPGSPAGHRWRTRSWVAWSAEAGLASPRGLSCCIVCILAAVLELCGWVEVAGTSPA